MVSEGNQTPVYKPQGRQVPIRTRLFLFVRADGRCEFDGCNRYLLEHHLTKTAGIFAQMAHIWAFSDRGPRANRSQATNKHDASNLMLLCPECHKLVDEHPERYMTEVLRQHKKAHEDRVFLLTDTKPDRHTVAFVLCAKVAGQVVSISRDEMEAAVAPRYLGRDNIICDLTAIPDRQRKHYWQTACDAICEKVDELYARQFEGTPARHVSVFALAPIPLLVFLGSRLSSKVSTTFYQRHRDHEDWRWKEVGNPVQFTTRSLQRGKVADRVALLLSLSGQIRLPELPTGIDDRYTIVEISLASHKPSPGFLAVEASLHAFRGEFMVAMRQLVAKHEKLDMIEVFPAVPAPVAVAVGRDLLPKRDPALRIHDYDKRAGGFRPALEVNHHETQ